MKVLVTGADGMVARAVASHCLGFGDEVTALNRSALDITDEEAVSSTITNGTYNAVINCAAFTDVDGAEARPEACYAVNALGVRNLAAACAARRTRFVTISTDYVFDGKTSGYYSEVDEPIPLGAYGKAKLEGERLALQVEPRSVVVRSGWIFGPGGMNFLSVMHRLLGEGKRIKAIRDSYGTPTYAVDLAARLRELAGSNAEGLLHVVNGGEGTSYLGFAEAVCEAGGFDRSLIEEVSYKELKRPAPRPANSMMKSVRLECLGLKELPDWHDAVRRFLEIEAK